MRDLIVLSLVFLAIMPLGATDPQLSGTRIQKMLMLSDRRTAYERAVELLQLKTDTTQAISLLETWLEAVPIDTNAARILANVYEAKGRREEALLARNIKPLIQRPHDQRVQTIYTPQVRLGLYRVMLPKNFDRTWHYPTVLVLHGNGQNPDVMIDWARTLNMDSVIFVFPQAPYAKVMEMMQTHRRRFSASGDGLDIPDTMMSEVVDESASWYHDAFLDAQSKYPSAKIKPVVIGFSQGGFYAHVIAGRFPATFQGVVSVSASMWEYGRVLEYLPSLRPYGVEALLFHGNTDNVVPLQTSELLFATLKNAGVSAELIKFDGGHWPTPEVTKHIRNWLVAHLH